MAVERPHGRACSRLVSFVHAVLERCFGTNGIQPSSSARCSRSCELGKWGATRVGDDGMRFTPTILLSTPGCDCCHGLRMRRHGRGHCIGGVRDRDETRRFLGISAHWKKTRARHIKPCFTQITRPVTTHPPPGNTRRRGDGPRGQRSGRAYCAGGNGTSFLTLTIFLFILIPSEDMGCGFTPGELASDRYPLGTKPMRSCMRSSLFYHA